jgi:Pentapeptide repeats (8 copies)
LSCREIGDLNVEVKWSCPSEKFCPSGNRYVLEVKVVRAEELLERYAAGEREFDGVDIGGGEELVGANLSGIRLTNSFLNEIFMDKIDLSGANLSGTNFAQSSMAMANLRGANLSCANLQYVDLRASDLTDSLLINACLIATTMSDINLTGANLTNAEVGEDFWIERKLFSNTVMPDGSICASNIFSRSQALTGNALWRLPPPSSTR